MTFPKPPPQLSEKELWENKQREQLAKHTTITNAALLTHDLPLRRRTLTWRCVFSCNEGDKTKHYKIYADNEAQCCKVAVTLLATPKLVYSDLITKGTTCLSSPTST